MDFNMVIETCIDFAKAHGGTIATYPVGYRKLEVHSRTTRTEIAVEHVSNGVWQIEHAQDASGERASETMQVSTTEDLKAHLLRLWAQPEIT
jgi:hypothetical protein